MKTGDLILANLPQADGIRKLRPALILSFLPPFQDCLVCGVSTQLHQAVSDFDEVIRREDKDFSTSGLLSASVCRLGFVTTLPQRRIGGVLGTIDPSRLERLQNRLARHLTKTG